MTTFQFWGKSTPTPAGVSTHPLVDHAIDVAIVLRELVAIPSILRRLETSHGRRLTSVQLDQLAVIALLHDLGKCNWGFQAKNDPAAHTVTGHVDEAVAFLVDGCIRPSWPEEWIQLVASASSWFEDSDAHLCQLLLAAISHHGRPVGDGPGVDTGRYHRWWKRHDRCDPMLGVAELCRSARSAFPGAFVPVADRIDATAALQQRFAGLVMLADWIGSDTQFFPYRAGPSENRAEFARIAAARALASIGVVPPDSRSSRGFAEIFPGYEPTPLQQFLAGSLPIDANSRLVLVESDTGSGKTEAALAWFFRLFAEGVVDGLYFALPTRVAARELYGRVMHAHAAAFPDPSSRPGPVLLAAPGYVRIDGETPILPEPEGRLWEDDATQRRRERQWAALHPKRFLAAPLAVGTIDQALLSALKVKHALLRSVCLDRSLLVVDEVHASDPYMRELLSGLLRGHLARGGYALLLSATLGESSRSVYFEQAPRELAEAVTRPYPSVTTSAGEQPIRRTAAMKSVRIDCLSSLDATAGMDAIADAVAQGARVLVVCNTVRRAIELQRAVEACGRIPDGAYFRFGEVICPHHGRFAREHREHLDGAVSRRLGKASANGAALLIGTQTLEQSLDIDADWLVSDLCPMDVLLQRIGRLHRHARQDRPTGFHQARVLLRGPEDLDLRRYLTTDGRFRGPAGSGLGTVYTDGRVLQRTLDLATELPTWSIPNDNRSLVERALHPDSLAMMDPAWRRHGDEIIAGREMAEMRSAFTSLADQNLPFGELIYPSQEEKIVTRLGGMNVVVRLSQTMRRPFGIPITSVTVPDHLVGTTDRIPECVDPEEHDDGFTFRLNEKRFRYTRFGLEVDGDA